MKPPTIGQDGERNEYWVFKDDLTKIFIKNTITNEWGVYDDEISVLTLELSLSS